MRKKRRVQNWSVWQDLQIGLATFLGLAGGIGIPALITLWLLGGKF